MEINLNLPLNNVNIIVEKNLIHKLGDILIKENIPYDVNTTKFYLIYDENTFLYANEIKKQFNNVFLKIVPEGDKCKDFIVYKECIDDLLNNNFNKNDFIISVGGGAICDLGGFVSATYMRGIKLINIPTTLLSQVDASIGGKNGIDYNGIKNLVGTIYQPSLVLVDINTLKTLSLRQFTNGLCEIIKISILFSKQLFNEIKKINFEKYIPSDCKYVYYNNNQINENLINVFDRNNNFFNKNDIIKKYVEDNEDLILNIITQSIILKKNIIEQDEFDKNIRQSLNFGHTIGHAIESYYGNEKLLHGECIAVGMCLMASNQVKKEIKNVLNNIYVNSYVDIDKNKIMKIIINDKKHVGNKINIITCNEIGEYNHNLINENELIKYLDY